MKFGVITFPGSNCDHDMIYVLKHILKQEVVELWHQDTDLKKCDVIMVPGGFSYGDYLRCGAIASHSNIMESVKVFANKGGYVIGVCNGFQILCESGLLPGVLLTNDNQKFVCQNQYLKVEGKKTVFTQHVEKEILSIPIAHADGRYFVDDKTYAEMLKNGQILFRYCDAEGFVTPESNPNGAIKNVAGVCNSGKNVFGMMPHPERSSDAELGNEDGLQLFKSLLKSLEKSKKK